MRDNEAPALEPPPGVKSNFKHPPNSDLVVLLVVITSLLLSTAFFFLCAYGKWYLQKKVRANDCTCSRCLIVEVESMSANIEFTLQELLIIAYILFLGYLTGWFLILGRQLFHGLFVHQWDIQNKHLSEVLFSTFVFANLYIIINGMLKTAILWEWTRIFPRRSRQRGIFYWACWVSLFFNVFWWGQSLVVLNVQCRPLKRAWDRRVTGVCDTNEKLYDMISAIINVALDTAIGLLPQMKIWGKWSAHDRDVVCALTFGTSLSAFVMGLGRLSYTVRYNESKDDTYNSSAIALWSLAELTCGIMTYTMNGAYLAVHRMSYGLDGNGDSYSEGCLQDIGGANQDPDGNHCPQQHLPPSQGSYPSRGSNQGHYPSGFTFLGR
ncbi:hypothetical protein F4678DRAFT_484303 [Xylaria arbuscula]|nr:hypothetical protein F4678DRAFT_484303 [Xylaria arbuscula]